MPVLLFEQIPSSFVCSVFYLMLFCTEFQSLSDAMGEKCSMIDAFLNISAIHYENKPIQIY